MAAEVPVHRDAEFGRDRDDVEGGLRPQRVEELVVRAALRLPAEAADVTGRLRGHTERPQPPEVRLNKCIKCKLQ